MDSVRLAGPSSLSVTSDGRYALSRAIAESPEWAAKMMFALALYASVIRLLRRSVPVDVPAITPPNADRADVKPLISASAAELPSLSTYARLPSVRAYVAAAWPASPSSDEARHTKSVAPMLTGAA